MKLTCNIIVVFGLLVAMPYAMANDTYNFYFQKAPGVKTVIQGGKNGQVVKMDETQEEPKPLEEEVLEGVPEQKPDGGMYDDTLDIPTSTNASELSLKDETKNKKPVDETKWSIALGVGSIQGEFLYYDTPWDIVGGARSFNQPTYILSFYHHLNKYFDAGLIFHLPDHQQREEKIRDSTIAKSPEVSAELGVTPIHLKIFGAEMLSFGAVGGVVHGGNFDGNKHEQGTTGFLGPRISVNLSEAVSLVGISRISLVNDSHIRTSLSLAYKW